MTTSQTPLHRRDGTPAPAARPRHPSERPLPWRATLAVLAAAVAAYGASHALAAAPWLAERGYGQGLGPLLSRPLSLVTGVFPFAVSELLAAAWALWLGAALVGALRAVAAGRRGLVHAAAAGGLRLIRDGSVLVVLLYVLWGFNYARPPLEERIGWPAWQGAELAEVVALAESAVAVTNRLYLEIHGTEDAGVPTPSPEDWRPTDRALEVGWARATDLLGLPTSAGKRHGPVKRPLSSPLIARLGIFGVYSPFTAEANVPRGLPAVRVGLSMGHEQAHQRGVAVEAEASFLGFVAASLAPDPRVRYSAASWAEGQLTSALPARERRRIIAARLPGVERDLRDLLAYQRRNATALGEVQSAVNDRYLRANRVPGGIGNYGRAVRLIILHAQVSGGELFPRAAPAP